MSESDWAELCMSFKKSKHIVHKQFVPFGRSMPSGCVCHSKKVNI